MGRAEEIVDAIILMAGAGSRLGEAGALAKPLVQVGGRPLICYAFDALQRAGVRRVHAVMGVNGARLSDEIAALLPNGMELNSIENPQWRKQNGVSVLCAESHVAAPFFLAMGDHIYEFALLEALLAQGDFSRSNLAIDRKVDSIFDLDDAMKVRTNGSDRILAIGKDLADYDAIDTGVFLCSLDLFAALRRAQEEQAGDCSLSDGVRLLAAKDGMRAIDIAEAWWQDVDTPEMWRRAEEELTRLGREIGRGRAQESVSRQD